VKAETIQFYNKKSVAQLIQIATRDFNAYIRKRDSEANYFVCISCNTPKAKSKMNAGHYYSAGNHPVARFNEDNVFGQCVQCNLYLHGNLIPYRKNLIQKIGIERVQAIDNRIAMAKKPPLSGIDMH
jgi:hypothetical protein